MPAEDRVMIGRIVRPQGNRGEVVVAPETDFGDRRFQVGATVWRSDEPSRPLTVTSSREHDGRWVVGFGGVASIDDAEALRGVELTIPASDLQPLASGGYYVHDLIGCRVETHAGAIVGPVRDVQFGSGVPLLVVDAAAAEVLVPFTEAICRRVDLDAKVVVIEPPEGLLELNETRARR